MASNKFAKKNPDEKTCEKINFKKISLEKFKIEKKSSIKIKNYIQNFFLEKKILK